MTPEDRAARQSERALGDEAARIFETRSWNIAYDTLAKRYSDVVFSPASTDEQVLDAPADDRPGFHV